MHKFISVIGHRKYTPPINFPTGYKIEKFFYFLRMMIAMIIFPELRSFLDKERYNLDYIIQIRKDHAKNMRARDKAINRLQQRIKDLNQQIRNLES